MITGRILRTEQSTDGRANIKIMVEFSEDGIVIVPEWTLWAQMSNFLGMTPTQISEWIRINIEAQIGNLIIVKNKSKLNTDVMTTIDGLATKEFSTDKVDIIMEASAVIPTTYIVTLNADGTYVVK